MMKKLLTAITLSAMLLVTGCQTTKLPPVVKEIQRVVLPPKALFVCPQVGKIDIPNWQTATNQQVADFIAILYKNNKICGNNMKSIERFLNEVKMRVERGDSKESIEKFVRNYKF